MPDLSASLPSALRANAVWTRLAGVPAMLVRPTNAADGPFPAVLWMHGRTAHKELDPGRFLRLMRSGIGVCAVDLPGHGERFDLALQAPTRTLDVVLRMVEEIDAITDALGAQTGFDASRLALGGMSAGGMAALARLTRSHAFVAAAVEATTGSWHAQREREMFRERTPEEYAAWNPIRHLDGWREIPFLALHARHDAWVDFAGQEAFVDELRRRAVHPERIELVVYEETGAPHEHVGFGRHAADAKERVRAFLARELRAAAAEAD